MIWIIIWKPNICLYGVLTWLVFSEVLFKISGFLMYTQNLYRFRRNRSQQFNRQNWFCVVTNQLLTLQHFPFISGFPVSVSCFIGLSSIARKKNTCENCWTQFARCNFWRYKTGNPLAHFLVLFISIPQQLLRLDSLYLSIFLTWLLRKDLYRLRRSCQVGKN